MNATTATHIVYLSLGSNLGDRRRNLITALQRLQEIMDISKISSLYETEPVDYLVQPQFFNIICSGRTTLSPQKFLQYVKETEELIGRQPSVRYGPRLIDIDIIFYDDLHLVQEDLIIPHPRMAERAFVLVPLVEIAPTVIDPVSGKTVDEMLQSISQNSVNKQSDLNVLLERDLSS
jgi:2-amino-4-hydroxy-6-hydroxymethyldihydropteridine diphosphokinase